MAIKKSYIALILFLISGLLLMSSSSKNQFVSSSNVTTQSKPDISTDKLSINGYEYISKVFTFTKSINTYILVYNLPKAYMHSIILQVVTPHSCTMNITLWDSIDREFQIFYATISQGSGEISTPFGTAISGNYSFQFKVETEVNLNIKITIRNNGIICLYDKIPMEEHGRIIFYEVTCFSNGYFIQHDISFLTEQRYKFYIGRVSSISILLSNRGDIFFNISDPSYREFQIYANNSLAGIADVNIFTFGTAVAGMYTIDIELYFEVPWMSVAYAIIDDGKICDPPPDSNQTSVEHYFWVPLEWGFLTVIGIGSFMGVIVVGIVINRKKNHFKIKIKD
ncbi:MAG: hypothetical protein ACFE8E_02890 [Candidatus Hodarchaeota archaeon]